MQMDGQTKTMFIAARAADVCLDCWPLMTVAIKGIDNAVKAMTHIQRIVQWMTAAKPFVAVLVIQILMAGMDLLSTAAFKKGMSPYVLVVYRHAVATAVIAPFAIQFERQIRPKMTLLIFAKLLLLALFGPVIGLGMFLLGMKYTTATFASAMSNLCPALTFVLAWIFRQEKVKLRSTHSQAKIIGTIVTVGGSLIMTLVGGPMIHLPWTKTAHTDHHHPVTAMKPVKGGAFIAIGCFGTACFMILQAHTLISYPAELSISAWVCVLGCIEGIVAALIIDKSNAAVWSIHLDIRLVAIVFSGVFCSGLLYYLQGIVVKDRGPVFASAFSPLSMIMVAVFSSFVFKEIMHVGKVVGAVVIVGGLYMVIWGKKRDKKSPETKEPGDKEAGVATTV